MRNIWLPSALLLMVVFSSVASGNQTGSKLSLLTLPLGEQRNAVITTAQVRWGGLASCEMNRTGVGMTRRAYFLETCVFENLQGNTLYDETPVSATYHFLESQLVQISYEFTQLSDPAKFRRCAEKDAAKLERNQAQTKDALKQGISISDDFQISISDVELVERIHRFRQTP